MDFAQAVDQVILQHLDELKKPGVLAVRPGVPGCGRLADQEARHSRDGGPQTRRPAAAGQASGDHRRICRRCSTGHPAAAPARHQPDTVCERRRLRGSGTGAAGFSIRTRPFRAEPRALASAAVALRGAGKQQLQYVPPAGAQLKAVTDEMTITCHASPDAGWPTLKEFLEGTTDSLTVGMYDFTSTHIAVTVQSVLKKKSTSLNLILDHPPGKSNREQTDDQTVDDLTSALGARFHFAWALERADPKVTSWIFPLSVPHQGCRPRQRFVLALQRQLEQHQPAGHRPADRPGCGRPDR